MSSDGGATFAATAATGLPKGPVRFNAVPAREGDIWMAGGSSSDVYGLWHSTDSGATFEKVPAVQEADTVGFGKASPGNTYPAIYLNAKIGGVRGFFRSDDAGATFLRINDNRNQYGSANTVIAGDPNVYGRVYVGTNGRGVIYGDIKQ